MERIEQAIILAAGEGQRLRPFTALKPKVMIPIAGKPILQYVVEALSLNGMRQIIIVVGYKKEQVWDFFGSGEHFGVQIDYVTQPQQLGTAHALKQAEKMVKGKFLILSGDNIIEPETIASFMAAKPNAILVKEQEDVSKYGVVTVGNGVVEDIVEKPTEAPSNLANTGIYAFDPEVFEFARDEADLPEALRRMIAQGYRLTAEEAKGIWLDVVYPWDILKLNDITLRKVSPGVEGTVEGDVTIKGLVSIGRDTVIRANSYIVGPAIIGENCEIGPNACLFPATSLGDNVVISPFTQIRNSVIGDNVYIGTGSSIQDSIIDRGSILGTHFAARSGEAVVEIDGEFQKVSCGAMLGEGCNIEDSVVAQPGTMIGNHSQLRALKVVSGTIPDGSLLV